MNNKLSLLFLLMIASITCYGQIQPVKDYLNLKVPVNIYRTNYQLAWSAHPTKDYYKHEYLEPGDNLEHYKRLILIEALKGADISRNNLWDKR